MADATRLLTQIYTWLPAAFLVDFLVVGGLMTVVGRRARARAAAREPGKTRPGADAKGSVGHGLRR